MIARLVLSLVVSVVLGLLLLRVAWPRGGAAWRWPLAVALGLAPGLAASGLLFFAWLLAFGPARGFPAAELLLVGVLAVAAWWRGRTRHPSLRPEGLPRESGPAGHSGAPDTTARPGDGRGPLFAFLLRVAGLLVLAAAAGAFASILLRHPHGDWDAWMDWDLKARMFFRGGDAWRGAFSAAIPWSHPGYPPLLPALVARSWVYAGRETQMGPALVAAAFTFGTAALLAAALWTLRGATQAIVAVIVLLSTPFFVVHGTSLYADVPVGFFFLATFVCLVLEERYGAGTGRFAVLAGVMAGLSACTKNEGLLFVLAVGGGLMLASALAGRSPFGRGARYRLVRFAAGALLPVALTAAFKIAFAPPNDLLSTLGIHHTLANLTSWHRYSVTLRSYLVHLTAFGSNGLGSVAWLLLAYALAVGVSRAELDRPWARSVGVALLLITAGEFVVFVSMAQELARLLASSLDRLLLQLWPGALLLYFAVVRRPEEAAAVVTAEPGRAARPPEMVP